MTESEKARVVVVEDDALVAEVVREMLQECGYSVVATAPDGEAAVDMCVRLEPDVVVLDLQLPIMDGLAAARAINERKPMPMVVLTAYDDPKVLRDATEVGVGAYLVKPPSLQELCRALSVARARFADLAEL